ncbi:uncharacterized [Tachysurus ichikawai]
MRSEIYRVLYKHSPLSYSPSLVGNPSGSSSSSASSQACMLYSYKYAHWGWCAYVYGTSRQSWRVGVDDPVMASVNRLFNRGH